MPEGMKAGIFGGAISVNHAGGDLGGLKSSRDDISDALDLSLGVGEYEIKLALGTT